MNNQEYQMLASEIGTIEEILEELPEERWLEKFSFENRLKTLKEELEKVEKESIRHKAVITFRGSPVFGTHGILVDFASKASGGLNDAVASIAASLSENLQPTGPIPSRGRNKLLITNIARGSFGFELEVPSDGEGTLIQEESNASKALEKMVELFNNSLNGNEEELSELVQEIHPRAVKKVVDFLDTLKNNDAWFAFEYKDRKVQYKSLEQVKKAIDLLSEGNIKEWEESFTGIVQGILPESRTFEFRNDNQMIKGKIGANIKDPIDLNKNFLLKPVKVKLKITQVGQSKPRYMLINIFDT